jgi:hypothetical protein
MDMAKHSRREREQRARESERIREIDAAWIGSLPQATLVQFTTAVEAARTRGPRPPQPDMAPGTLPQPPRFEPRPTKEERNRRPRN